MEPKFQRDFQKPGRTGGLDEEVNNTNLRGSGPAEHRDRSSSSGSSASRSSESSGSATAASSGRFMMQIETAQPTLEELHQRLGLTGRKVPGQGQHNSQFKPQLTLKRISLTDQSLPEENLASTAFVPIESFGQKILKDMGMGDPSRDLGVDKRPTEPILFVPRPEGMGIGAVSKQELMTMIRNGREVTDSDLRARHTNHVVGIRREERPENLNTCRLVYGEVVTVVEGKYRGLLGKVVEGEGVGQAGEQSTPAEDENLTEAELGERAIVVQLQINFKNVKMLRKQLIKGVVQINPADNGQHPEKEEKKKRRNKWVRPGLVCRIVSKKYRDGKYMDELGQIIDVPDCYTVSFQTFGHELLEDMEEKHLETVMPVIGERVLILKEEHAGKVGVLNERKKKENKVTIRIGLEDGGIDYLHMAQEDCCAITGSKLKG